MLAEAATPMGIHVRVLAAPGDEGATEVVPDVQVGAPETPTALRSFAATVDVVEFFDHENVDHTTLATVCESEGVAVRPGLGTLRLSDKAHQRRVFADGGLPVPPFEVVDPGSTPTAAVDRARRFAALHSDAEGRIGMAKASRGGYDGRGVWMLREDDIESFLAEYRGAPLVLEPKLPLELEVAVSWPVGPRVRPSPGRCSRPCRSTACATRCSCRRRCPRTSTPPPARSPRRSPT